MVVAFILPLVFSLPAGAGPWFSKDEDYEKESEKILFLSIGAGGSLPLYTGNWRDAVDGSFMGAIRAGYGLGDRTAAIYAAVGLDHAVFRGEAQGNGQTLDLSRSRLLLGLRYEQLVRERLLVMVRLALLRKNPWQHEAAQATIRNCAIGRRPHD